MKDARSLFAPQMENATSQWRDAGSERRMQLPGWQQRQVPGVEPQLDQQESDYFTITHPQDEAKVCSSGVADTGDDVQLTIEHFGSQEKEDIVKMPALGRMRLWESFSPMNNDSVTEILKTMRHSLLAVPFLPAAALAADL